MAPRSRSTIALSAALILLALTACAPDRTFGPSPDQDSTLPPPTPAPTATDSPDSPGVPINILCSELLTDQQIYDYNPNFAANGEYTPPAGSDGATLIDLEGVSCSWIQLSSSDTIEVSAANLPGPELAEFAEGTAAESTPTDLFGGEGYFTFDGTVGRAEVFVDDYWIIASSTYFFEAGDAAPLIEAALASLKG